jgi:hypothetical protein
MHLIAHVVHVGDRLKGRRDVLRRDLEALGCKFHPHEKIVCFLVGVMVGVKNVAPEVVNKPRHSRNDARAVFTMDQEYN